MAIRLDTPPVGGLPLYAEKWTIKCSSMKSGVFPFTLDTPSKGCGVNCLLFYPNCGPQNSHKQLLLPPGIKDLIVLTIFCRKLILMTFVFLTKSVTVLLQKC